MTSLAGVNHQQANLDENNETKRSRICLTNEQTNKLKIHFIRNPYPTAHELDEISVDVDLERSKVTAWFAHQRQVYKIQNKRKKP